MEKISLHGRTYDVVTKLKSNDFIDTFLCLCNNKKYIIEQYKLNDYTIQQLVENYYLLTKYRINTTMLFDYSLVERIIVKVYVDEKNVKDLLDDDTFEKEIYYRLCNLMNVCKKYKILLDFNSKNFIFNKRILYYNSCVVTKGYNEKTFKNKFLPTWIKDYSQLSFKEQEEQKDLILSKYNRIIKIRRR